jgi:hypothetical protein
MRRVRRLWRDLGGKINIVKVGSAKRTPYPFVVFVSFCSKLFFRFGMRVYGMVNIIVWE